ncbi:zeta toxin family protein [Candidatus Pacearchaeota archaeon]|nr:zeta toxin family protein [Candidatus Pacearchaeota archaeon]
MKKPNLIIIDGPIGSGKSTVANLLHKKMKRTAIVRLDRIKHLFSDYIGSSEDQQLSADVGKAMTKEYIKNDINVIVEKAFTREEFLKSFIEKIEKKSKVYIYQLHAPINLRKERVKNRLIPKDAKKRPTDKKIERNTEHFQNFRYKNAIEFDSSKLTVKQIANKILRDIK